jgi:hypothetical protein
VEELIEKRREFGGLKMSQKSKLWDEIGVITL